MGTGTRLRGPGFARRPSQKTDPNGGTKASTGDLSINGQRLEQKQECDENLKNAATPSSSSSSRPGRQKVLNY